MGQLLHVPFPALAPFSLLAFILALQVLFSTETFAMGVNAPARTVVFQSLRCAWAGLWEFLSCSPLQHLQHRTACLHMPALCYESPVRPVLARACTSSMALSCMPVPPRPPPPSCSKHDGKSFRNLLPGEYTQASWDVEVAALDLHLIFE